MRVTSIDTPVVAMAGPASAANPATNPAVRQIRRTALFRGQEVELHGHDVPRPGTAWAGREYQRIVRVHCTGGLRNQRAVGFDDA